MFLRTVPPLRIFQQLLMPTYMFGISISSPRLRSSSDSSVIANVVLDNTTAGLSIQACAGLLFSLMESKNLASPLDSALDTKFKRVFESQDSTWSQLAPYDKYCIFMYLPSVKKSYRKIPKPTLLEAFFAEVIYGDYSDMESHSTALDMDILFAAAGIQEPPPEFVNSGGSVQDKYAAALLLLIGHFLDCCRSRHAEPASQHHELLLARAKSDSLALEYAERVKNLEFEHAKAIQNLKVQLEAAAEVRLAATEARLTARLMEALAHSQAPIPAKRESKPAGKTPSSVYAVGVGRKPGIYGDWETAKAQIEGVKRSKHKQFTSTSTCSAEEQATTWLAQYGVEPAEFPALVSGALNSPPFHPPSSASCTSRNYYDDDTSTLSGSLDSKSHSSSPSNSSDQSTSSGEKSSQPSRTKSSRRKNSHKKADKGRRRSKLLKALRLDFPSGNDRPPISQEALLQAAASDSGFLIMTITESVVRYNFKPKLTSLALQQFAFTTLVGPHSNPDRDSIGIQANPRNPFIRSRKDVPKFFKEQRELLSTERHARLAAVDDKPTEIAHRLSAAEKLAALALVNEPINTWYRAQLDYLQQYSDAVDILLNRVLGYTGQEISPKFHISTMAAIAHLLLVHWNSNLAAGTPERLGHNLFQQWEAWFAPSLVVVGERPVQPLSTSMLFLGYSCSKCKSAGWSDDFCFTCSSFGASKPVSQTATDAAFATWVKTNVGKSKGDWHKTESFRSLQPHKVTHASARVAYEALALNQAVVPPLGCGHSF